MTTYKDWFIFLGVVALAAFDGNANDDSRRRLTYKLTNPTITPGERTSLEISIFPAVADAEGIAKTQFKDDLIYQDAALIILDKRTQYLPDRTTWIIDFTSHRAGEFTIPPIEIRTAWGTHSTERLTLHVSALREQNDWDIRKEFGPIPLRFDWGRWLFRVLATFLTMGILAIAYSYVLRHLPRKKKVQSIHATSAESNRDWLIRKVMELRDRHKEEPDNEELIDALTQMLRIYFTKDLHCPVDCWTTSEFMSRLTHVPPAGRLTKIFLDCDRIKFSPVWATSIGDTVLTSLEEIQAVLIDSATPPAPEKLHVAAS